MKNKIMVFEFRLLHKHSPFSNPMHSSSHCVQILVFYNHISKLIQATKLASIISDNNGFQLIPKQTNQISQTKTVNDHFDLLCKTSYFH